MQSAQKDELSPLTGSSPPTIGEQLLGYGDDAGGRIADEAVRCCGGKPTTAWCSGDFGDIRSVRIFLGALADRENNPELGLGYIDKALNEDPSVGPPKS